METLPGKRVLMLLACLAPVCWSGCAQQMQAPSWVPFAPRAEDRIPGVTPPHERIEALRAAARRAPQATADQRQQAVKELSQAIRAEKDPMVRAEIVHALGAYRLPEALPVLKAALDDPDPGVRIQACRSWADYGGSEAAAALGRALAEQTDVDVRLAAADALGRIKDPAAVSALGPALADNDPAIQYRAVQSLRAIAEEDFGNDVQRWQQYVRGEKPPPRQPVSVAEWLRQVF